MANTAGSFNSLVINNTGSGTTTRGTATISGNITAGNVNTGGRVVATGNINSSAHVIAVANVSGGNLTTTGQISATGNIRGNILVANTLVSTTNLSAISGTITNLTATTLNVDRLTQNNISTTGYVLAGGNVTGLNITANGNVVISGYTTSTGNVTGSNINGINVRATGSISGTNITATGNIIAASFLNANGTPYLGTGGPAFIATITSGQGLVTSPISITQRTLIYNTVSKNIDNGYNSSTGTFTAPKAGFYQVSAACAVTPSNVGQVLSYYGEAVLGIYRNGSPVAAGGFVDARGAIIGGVAIGAFSASSVSPLVYLNAGDTLQCKLAYITNAPTNFWNTYANIIPNYFQACWLRP